MEYPSKSQFRKPEVYRTPPLKNLNCNGANLGSKVDAEIRIEQNLIDKLRHKAIYEAVFVGVRVEDVCKHCENEKSTVYFLVL